MQTKQLTVLNKLGLHARPCALLAKTAGFFKSSITLTHNNHSVDAKSILGLMTMAVPAGTTLTSRQPVPTKTAPSRRSPPFSTTSSANKPKTENPP